MSVSLEIATKLATDGIGVVTVDLFNGYMPDAPHNLVAVYSRPGRDPIRTFAKTIVALQPNLSVVVRNQDYETGYIKAVAIRSSLQSFNGLIGSVKYGDITMMGDIFDLGTDENLRWLFTLNFRTIKDAS